MNYFILSEDPIIAATSQCDKHVVKMPIETGQMLCTALRMLHGTLGIVLTQQGDEVIERERRLLTDLGEYSGMKNSEKSSLYWGVHPKHPCTVWTGASFHNFLWAYNHGVALCAEYTLRYGRAHRSLKVIEDAYQYALTHKKGGSVEQTPFPQAMPDQYKHKNAVTAYRNYYLGEKRRFAKWTKRTPPNWWLEKI